MSVFELFFLLVVLAAVATVIAIATRVGGGQRASAARLARRLGLGLALYMLTLIGASLVLSARVVEFGTPQCFDDWCITVASTRWVDAPRPQLEVLLRLSSQARQRPMGERGTYVYVLDGEGRRYDATIPPGEAQFDTVLQPGQSVDTVRHFDVPRDASHPALIYARSGFPIGWLIIAEEGWFQPPRRFLLDVPQ